MGAPAQARDAAGTRIVLHTPSALYRPPDPSVHSEEGLVDPHHSVHVGLRGPLYSRLDLDESEAAELDATLYSLAEGLRVVTVLLHPYMPKKTRVVLEALGDERLELAAAAFGAGATGPCAP